MGWFGRVAVVVMNKSKQKGACEQLLSFAHGQQLIISSSPWLRGHGSMDSSLIGIFLQNGWHHKWPLLLQPCKESAVSLIGGDNKVMQ